MAAKANKLIRNRLLKLEIEGFRSLRRVTWEPGNLNVLIGRNAGGKSNLLKAFEFISVAAGASVRNIPFGNLGKYVQQEGGMEPLVWDGVPGGRIKLLAITELSFGKNSQRFDYELQLVRRRNTPSFQIDEETLWKPLEGKLKPNRRLYHRTNGSVSNTEKSSKEWRHVLSSALDNHDETILARLSDPIVATPALRACGEFFSHWKSYQDFRTDLRAPARASIISRSEQMLDPDGQNLVNVLHTLYTGNRDFKRSINDAMHVAFPDQFEELVFPPGSGDQQIQLAVRWKGLTRPTSSTDLSDGTLRFLYLLAVLSDPSPPSLIAIDEPEGGLHPRMLSIVAELAADMSNRVQVVFTTHSPEFLDVLTEFRPNTYTVELHEAGTQINKLSGERLDHWLKEYSLGELYRTRSLETIL